MQDFDPRSHNQEFDSAPAQQPAQQPALSGTEIGPKVRLSPELSQRLRTLSRVCERIVSDCSQQPPPGSSSGKLDDAGAAGADILTLALALQHVHLELEHDLLPYSAVEIMIEEDDALEEWLEAQLREGLTEAAFKLALDSSDAREALAHSGVAMHHALVLEEHLERLEELHASALNGELKLPPELSADMLALVDACHGALELNLEAADGGDDDDDLLVDEIDQVCLADDSLDADDADDEPGLDSDGGALVDFSAVVNWKPEDSLLADLLADLEAGRLKTEHLSILLESEDAIREALIATAHEKLSEAADLMAQSPGAQGARIWELYDLFDLYLQIREGDLEETLLEFA